MNASARPTEAIPARELRAEASAWIAKLHGSERSRLLEADFRSWLNADPEHARAFEMVTGVWESLGNVNIGGLPRLASTDAFADGRRWLRPALAFSACAALVLGFVWLLQGKTYSTDIGEQRVVSLEDGTRLSLNSNTRIGIDFANDRRSIRLERGEAFFEVSRDPARPFSVIAGGRRVTALGTSFVVRYENGRFAVTLVDGKVAVAPVEMANIPVHTLQPGQRLTVRAGRDEQLDLPRVDAMTAWRRGEVILDETPLSVAIEEMNRYERVPLTLDHPRLGALHVSGIYKTGDGRGFAHAVAEVYDLSVVDSNGKIHLRPN